MSYISRIFVFVALLVLAGCAGTPANNTVLSANSQTGKSTQDAAKAEIALYGKAITYLNDKHYDQARTIFTTLMKKRPQLAGPWANLALIDITDNHLDQAKEKLDKAISLDPGMFQAYNLLGYLEKRKGNINKALGYYLKAIDTNPDYAIAHYNVALLYDIYFQDIPEAIKHYKRYLEINKNQDRKTADWVAELENTLKRGKL